MLEDEEERDYLIISFRLPPSSLPHDTQLIQEQKVYDKSSQSFIHGGTYIIHNYEILSWVDWLWTSRGWGLQEIVEVCLRSLLDITICGWNLDVWTIEMDESRRANFVKQGKDYGFFLTKESFAHFFVNKGVGYNIMLTKAWVTKSCQWRSSIIMWNLLMSEWKDDMLSRFPLRWLWSRYCTQGAMLRVATRWHMYNIKRSFDHLTKIVCFGLYSMCLCPMRTQHVTRYKRVSAMTDNSLLLQLIIHTPLINYLVHRILIIAWTSRKWNSVRESMRWKRHGYLIHINLQSPKSLQSWDKFHLCEMEICLG